MWNKPDDCPTEEIHKLSELEAGTKAKAVLAEHLERALTIINPETVLGNKPEIDLRGLDLDVRYEYHGTFRGVQQWTAWDERTYDGTNEIGHGESREDALVDLLDQLDEPAPPPRQGKVIHSSPYEPPTIVPGTQEDWEHDDAGFDSDLENSDGR